MKEKYNPTCRCGHLHSEHNEAASTTNVSAGKCSQCECEYFVVEGNAPTESKEFLTIRQTEYCFEVVDPSSKIFGMFSDYTDATLFVNCRKELADLRALHVKYKDAVEVLNMELTKEVKANTNLRAELEKVNKVLLDVASHDNEQVANLRAERDKIVDVVNRQGLTIEKLKAENEQLKEYLLKRLEYCKKNNLHYYHNVEINDIQNLLNKIQ